MLLIFVLLVWLYWCVLSKFKKFFLDIFLKFFKWFGDNKWFIDLFIILLINEIFIINLMFYI